MTLLITIIAAIISTIIWYKSQNRSEMKIGTLCLIYWGASIMWFVDAIFEYIELKSDYFTPSLASMLNDAFLGVCVVVLGAIIWLVILLANDSSGAIKSALLKKKS